MQWVTRVTPNQKLLRVRWMKLITSGCHVQVELNFSFVWENLRCTKRLQSVLRWGQRSHHWSIVYFERTSEHNSREHALCSMQNRTAVLVALNSIYFGLCCGVVEFWAGLPAACLTRSVFVWFRSVSLPGPHQGPDPEPSELLADFNQTWKPSCSRVFFSKMRFDSTIALEIIWTGSLLRREAFLFAFYPDMALFAYIFYEHKDPFSVSPQVGWRYLLQDRHAIACRLLLRGCFNFPFDVPIDFEIIVNTAKYVFTQLETHQKHDSLYLLVCSQTKHCIAAWQLGGKIAASLDPLYWWEKHFVNNVRNCAMFCCFSLAWLFCCLWFLHGVLIALLLLLFSCVLPSRALSAIVLVLFWENVRLCGPFVSYFYGGEPTVCFHLYFGCDKLTCNKSISCPHPWVRKPTVGSPPGFISKTFWKLNFTFQGLHISETWNEEQLTQFGPRLLHSISFTTGQCVQFCWFQWAAASTLSSKIHAAVWTKTQALPVERGCAQAVFARMRTDSLKAFYSFSQRIQW